MSLAEKIIALEKIVGSRNILTDESSKLQYGKDLTKNYAPNPIAIVFPESEQAVIDIVKWANATHTPLVPSGGRTGYSGGAVAIAQEIVVAMDKMNRILDINPHEQTIRCEAGVITNDLKKVAAEHELFYPVDYISMKNSQIGGNIATNGGGMRVLRYGLTRNWVTGLRVVTGNGDVLELNSGLIKNATGYDLRHLFIGSEGTLGFITQATLKLIPIPHKTNVILFAMPETKNLTPLLNAFTHAVKVSTFEFFSDIALHHVLEKNALTPPLLKKSPCYALLEYEDTSNAKTLVNTLIDECRSNGLIKDSIVSQNHEEYEKLWQLRAWISMSLSDHTPYKYDISVMPSKIASFMVDAEMIFRNIYPDSEIVWFGHVGDGNLHLNILKPAAFDQDEFFSYCASKSDALYSLIQQYQGSISAEHGVGLLKKPFLHYTKSEEEIQYMKLIKNVFDKNNIMNPGKIF